MEPVKEAIRTHSEPIRGARHDARALGANQRCSSRREETHGGSRGARGAQHSASERNGAQHSAAVLESSGRTGAQGSAYWRARAESHFTSWLLFVPGWLKSCTAAAKRPAKVWRGESAQPDVQSIGDGARLGARAPSWAPSEEPSRGGEIALSPSLEMALEIALEMALEMSPTEVIASPVDLRAWSWAIFIRSSRIESISEGGVVSSSVVSG